MNISILLSSNDWDDLRCHLLNMQEYTLTRMMGNVTLVATVEPVNSNAWHVAMLVGVRVTCGDWMCRQWFQSVEEAQRRIRGWRFDD